MDIPPISIALDELDVPHKIFRHETPVTSFEQAANDRGQRASQIVRSILFRVSEDEFVMALVAGPAQISWKILRKHLGRSRISMLGAGACRHLKVIPGHYALAPGRANRGPKGQTRHALTGQRNCLFRCGKDCDRVHRCRATGCRIRSRC